MNLLIPPSTISLSVSVSGKPDSKSLTGLRRRTSLSGDKDPDRARSSSLSKLYQNHELRPRARATAVVTPPLQRSESAPSIFMVAKKKNLSYQTSIFNANSEDFDHKSENRPASSSLPDLRLDGFTISGEKVDYKALVKNWNIEKASDDQEAIDRTDGKNSKRHRMRKMLGAAARGTFTSVNTGSSRPLYSGSHISKWQFIGQISERSIHLINHVETWIGEFDRIGTTASAGPNAILPSDPLSRILQLAIAMIDITKDLIFVSPPSTSPGTRFDSVDTQGHPLLPEEVCKELAETEAARAENHQAHSRENPMAESNFESQIRAEHILDDIDISSSLPLEAENAQELDENELDGEKKVPDVTAMKAPKTTFQSRKAAASQLCFDSARGISETLTKMAKTFSRKQAQSGFLDTSVDDENLKRPRRTSSDKFTVELVQKFALCVFEVHNWIGNLLLELERFGCSPTVVFVNPRSGGQLGNQLLREFYAWLNPWQIVDMSREKDPREALRRFRPLAMTGRMRILACGGDGTVSWIVNSLEAEYRNTLTFRTITQLNHLCSQFKESIERLSDSTNINIEEDTVTHDAETTTATETDSPVKMDGQKFAINSFISGIGRIEMELAAAPIAVLPLGTGNDLAKILNWGATFESSANLFLFLRRMVFAKPVQMDLWTMEVFAEPPMNTPLRMFGRKQDTAKDGSDTTTALLQQRSEWKSGHQTGLNISSSPTTTSSRHALGRMPNLTPWGMATTGRQSLSEKVKVEKKMILRRDFTNYVDFGIAARIALKFHTLRESHPELFRSRLGNKFLYGEVGVRDFLVDQPIDLSSTEVTADGVRIDLSYLRREGGLEGIAIINIPSFGGGVNPWKNASVSSCNETEKKDNLRGLDSQRHNRKFDVTMDNPSEISSDASEDTDEGYAQLNQFLSLESQYLGDV